MLHKAKLISRTSREGWDLIDDNVPLGKVYWVDLGTIHEQTWGHRDHPGESIQRQVVSTYDTAIGNQPTGVMFLEVLEIEPNA